MRAPEDDEQEPPGSTADDRRTSVVWWLALGVAVCFLIGAVGYFVGVRVTQSSDSLSATDVGFLQDMIDHHDQAVELALLELSNGSDSTARQFAQETIIFQRREIGIMETMLTDGGKARGEVPRDVMGWMDMAMPLSDMPGLASKDQMDQLQASSGADADRQYLELMRTHHLGGIHMADWEAQYGSNQRAKDLASTIATYQRSEVNEYTMLMQKLGYA